MKRSLYRTGCASLVLAACALPATAQVMNDHTNKKLSEAAAKLGNAPAVSPDDAIGILVAPGISVTPSAFIEGGYDSNPDRFGKADGSAFLRTGAGLGLSAVGERTIANLAASGSWMGFAEDMAPHSRLSGTVRGNVTHQLAPGWTVSATGLVDHDASKRIVADTLGASTELGYRSDMYGAFLRGSFVDVEFDDARPAHKGKTVVSAFDAQKDQLTAGGMLMPRNWVSPYIEGAAAKVNYGDEVPAVTIDRDGNDYYVKGGVRVVLSPQFRADLGWRWNRRDVNSGTDFASDYFDGSLTWTPSRFFSLTASIEREIAEPSSTRGLMADAKSYELKANWLPIDRVGVSLSAQRSLNTDIGGDFAYHSTAFGAGVTYDYSSRVQFYSIAQYEYLDVDWHDEGYTRFKALAGVRLIPDGANVFKGASADDLATHIKAPRLPSDADLTIATGYSWFNLPGRKMTTVVGGPFFDQSLHQFTDNDGGIGGGRIDVRLANMARHYTSEGPVNFSLSGFYAGFAGKSSLDCNYTASTDCAIVNITDFNPDEENNTGAFGLLHTRTDRDAAYFGASLEARFGNAIQASLKDGFQGSLKDSAPEVNYSPIKFGLSARGLNERIKLTATDPAVCLPVKYDEKLDTHYYGGYVGFEQQVPLGAGWTASFDSTAGLYYADTTYQGRYSGYVPVIAPYPGFAGESGVVNASNTRGAFIGSVRLGLSQDLGWGTLGVFGQAEYLSYAPSVAYNNNDQAGGSPWGLQGSQNGTRIINDDAVNYTGSVSLTVKLP